ncbi:hypothetical protein [Pseudorhodobacter ferrugineus]|uniref:hypothetical protein n=1 Tax=Pseudorhodobacter ferrugineus TaxID=77008 RepID=UPI0003B4D9EA|nr:hypothetical protein [Pseudorhodobacter ferrugineus]
MEDIRDALARIEAQLARQQVVPEYLDTAGASVLTGIPVQGLEIMRTRRQGPTYCKVGRSVRYAVRDLRAFMEQERHEPLA